MKRGDIFRSLQQQSSRSAYCIFLSLDLSLTCIHPCDGVLFFPLAIINEYM